MSLPTHQLRVRVRPTSRTLAECQAYAELRWLAVAWHSRNLFRVRRRIAASDAERGAYSELRALGLRWARREAA